MNPNNTLYREEGYGLMAAAFEVHQHNGGGLAEEVYQECLEIELELSCIPFRSKQEIAIYYKERELQRRYVPDLFVHDGIVVELKSVITLMSEHETQLLNYMRLSKKSVGYLINFGPSRAVEYKRFVIG